MDSYQKTLDDFISHRINFQENTDPVGYLLFNKEMVTKIETRTFTLPASHIVSKSIEAEERIKELEDLLRVSQSAMAFDAQNYENKIKALEQENKRLHTKNVFERLQLEQETERLNLKVKEAWFESKRQAKIANSKIFKGSTMNLLTFEGWADKNGIDL